ncbi:MAG TPA: hypothetical protein VKE70_28825 [Candidatus Solibacter sp.]|nr:hypothetical protein [Candidatus Solibacter sp.]
MKPSGVVLLEDGVSRGFTTFEKPPEHFTLDLVVMFDVTTPRPDPRVYRVTVWNTKALLDLTAYWSETIVRRLLDVRGASIRFSVYRLDQSKLQRLCRSTSDPTVLLDALHRLAGPSTASQSPRQGEDIPLPAGLAVRTRESKALASGRYGAAPEPWSLAGALAVLRDSGIPVLPDADKAAAEDHAAAARAVVIFSTGAEASSITPENVAEAAITAAVPIYPVGLYAFPPVVPYDGYGYDGQFVDGAELAGRSMWGPAGPYLPIWGPADLPNLPPNSPPAAPYFNYPFESLGELTGGLHFESVNHSQPIGDSGRFVLDRNTSLVFSMTGGETEEILERIKKHALARFSSTYMVGFVPPPSGAPREHKLEVKLAPKSGGKVSEGKRIATY